MQALLPVATAVLTDPAYGLGPGITSRVIGGQVGLLAPLEVTDYDSHPGQRQINFIEGWSVAKIKRCGGSGVKLLLNYHPEAANTQEQHQIVAQIAEECTRHDLPFFLEPLTYSPDPQQTLDNETLRQIVVEMAHRFSDLGVDVLKLQFPVDPAQEPDPARWQSAAEAVNAACAVPWTILSAGVDYDTFETQARIACTAGASGVIVGRAVWNEAIVLNGVEREDFLQTTARQRMQRLAAICTDQAPPWFERCAAPEISETWYENYPE
jgi:tagatose-1,6-bisphosphate aldolase